MTTQIIDLSQIDLTGGLRLNGGAFRAAHINGERLWPFGVDLLYAGGIGGASYLPDPADVYGASALAAFGEGVSAVLDEKNGTPVLGPELVTNGGFDSDVIGWRQGLSAAMTWDAGALRITEAGGSNPRVDQSFPTVAGRWYICTATYQAGASNFATGAVRVSTAADLGGVDLGTVTLSRGQTVVFQFRAVGATTFVGMYLFGATSGSLATGAFDDISAREIPGIPARQPSIAFRPMLGRAPKAGRRNQITFSEQFDDPAFTKVGGTITPNAAVAPDGEVTADQLVEGAGTVNGASIRRTNPSFWLGNMGLSAAISIHAKEVVGSAKRYLVLGADNGSTRWAYIIVDLATGAVTATRPDGIQTGVIAGSVAVEPAENGYYRVSLAVSSPLASSSYSLRAGITDTPTPTFTTADIPAYTGDGASGLMLWGLQAEPGSVVSAYQRIGANLNDVTEPGVPSYPFIRFDLSDDRLDTVLPQALTGDVVIAGRNGSVIAPHSYAANATFQLGPASYTGGTPGILSAVGDVVGWSILGKTLTAAGRERLLRFYKRRGAKGLLVPGGPELVTNGGFDTDTDWTKGTGWTIAGGVATKAAGTAAGLDQAETLIVGAAYLLTFTVARTAGTLTPQFIGGATQVGVSVNASGSYSQVLVAVTGSATLRFQADAAFAGTLDTVSLRRIRPEEDL